MRCFLRRSLIVLQLIGEMNNTAGTVEFGGRLAYCQQNGRFGLT